jgi:hypothetical protein
MTKANSTTQHLLKSPANAAHLKKSTEQAKGIRLTAAQRKTQMKALNKELTDLIDAHAKSQKGILARFLPLCPVQIGERHTVNSSAKRHAGKVMVVKHLDLLAANPRRVMFNVTGPVVNIDGAPGKYSTTDTIVVNL